MSIFSLLTLCTNAEPASVVRVLAIVNNVAVALADYNKYSLKTGSSASSETIDDNLLKQLIDKKIILMKQ